MIDFCNEAFYFYTACFSILLACLFNNFVLQLQHSPTLYEEVSRGWPREGVNQLALTYFVFTCSLLVTGGCHGYLSECDSVRLHYTTHSRGDFLLNFVCTELILKLGDRLQCSCYWTGRVAVHLLWCASYAPGMLVFTTEVSTLSMKATAVLLITLTTVAFFCNIEHQRSLVRRMIPVVLASHIFLTTISVLLIVLGYPHNILGFTLIVITLHFGFVFYALMFIASTHVLTECTKSGTQDIVENVTDLFVCTVNLFARISIFHSFNIVLSMH